MDMEKGKERGHLPKKLQEDSVICEDVEDKEGLKWFISELFF